MDEKNVISLWSSGFETYVCRRSDELYQRYLQATDACIKSILEQLRNRCGNFEQLTQEYQQRDKLLDMIQSTLSEHGYTTDDLCEFCEMPPTEYIMDSSFYLRYKELNGEEIKDIATCASSEEMRKLVNHRTI